MLKFGNIVLNWLESKVVIMSCKKYTLLALTIAVVHAADNERCKKWATDAVQDVPHRHTVCMQRFLSQTPQNFDAIDNPPQHYHLPIIRTLPDKRSLA